MGYLDIAIVSSNGFIKQFKSLFQYRPALSKISQNIQADKKILSAYREKAIGLNLRRNG
jgi:hypothetical protein